LKKAARIARSICDLSNPILSISAICAARSAPIARPEDSLKAGVAGIADGAAPAPAGEGVAGAAFEEEVVD
jgi:hypothetical protein